MWAVPWLGRDPDISIRRRALDLVYLLVNENNIRVLVRELLNYLLVERRPCHCKLVLRPSVVGLAGRRVLLR